MTAEGQAAVADTPTTGSSLGDRRFGVLGTSCRVFVFTKLLDSANDTPITLISAPAGSSNSLLTASWLAATGRGAA